MTVQCDIEKFLLDECPDAVIGTSVDGSVQYWSKGAESTFGFSSAEALGRNLNELIVPADRIAEEQRLRNESVAKDMATYESMRQRKDGSLLYVDITSKAVRNARGEITLLVSTKKDVTRLRLMRDAKSLEARFCDGIATQSIVLCK